MAMLGLHEEGSVFWATRGVMGSDLATTKREGEGKEGLVQKEKKNVFPILQR